MTEGIIYSVPESGKYEISVCYSEEHNTYTAVTNSMIVDGKSYPLHNNLSISFKITDDEICVFWGWHIGTEDFTFSKEEGDDCLKYIEKYNPRFMEQLKEKLKELKYL